MSDFFTDAQRQIQSEFESTQLADRIVEAAVHEELSADQIEFIHARNMFFLATVDEFGFPSCSYKGGSEGFVRVTSPHTLYFPSYDGNGMYLSMGNIDANKKVGLLFVDFEKPQRVRVRGEARCLRSGPMMDSYPGADMIIEVSVAHVWINCPRYIHQMSSQETSPYIPDAQGQARLALWKRLDLLQDVLNAADQERAKQLGLISIEQYDSMVATGRLI